MLVLKCVLYIAVFLNCWIAGRSVTAYFRETDIASLLCATVAVTGFNVLILSSFLLATLN